MLGNRVVNNILGVRVKSDKKSKNYSKHIYQTRDNCRKNNESERARIKAEENIMIIPIKPEHSAKFYGFNTVNKFSSHDVQSSITDGEIRNIMQKANIYDAEKENKLYKEQYMKKRNID